MKKKIAYLLFGVGTWLGNVFYLEGTEVDSAYRWENIWLLFFEGILPKHSPYKISTLAFTEVLLQDGANPNTPDDDGTLPIQHPILNFETTEVDVAFESSMGTLLVQYGAEIPEGLCMQGKSKKIPQNLFFPPGYWENKTFFSNYNPIKEAISKSRGISKKKRKYIEPDREFFLTKLLHKILKQTDEEISISDAFCIYMLLCICGSQ